MALRLYLGGPEKPLNLVPEKNLGETHTNFLREKIIEVVKAEVNQGRVKDLTNFEWDKLCIFVSNKILSVNSIGNQKIKNLTSNKQKKYIYMVFERAGVRQMTVRLRVTDQLGYDKNRPFRNKCFSETAIFYTKASDYSSERLLFLN